ncbi:AMP-binding protein [[Mycobacterium] burgundiense]|uniref:AMP-binding protein n=1 Tax=[Mycobacterium] burgundiense TaxID=3064286 RepID=A0ABM9M6F8_9MYCO|nr:AMP-binding protein [Mycolicibacterium sp. MU0053]CAJ1510752.1 AMP-binding protein [Mycolicibacterium sp. MU0053]
MRDVPPELTRRYRDNGWWTDETIGDLLTQGLKTHPGSTFRVHSAVRPFVGTFDDVEKVARRLAAGLRTRGIGPGDVVAFQLPNWMEAAATFWASAFLGAVVVPVVHFYGPKEVTHILRAADAKVFITAERFGRMSFEPEVCKDIPIVGVVGRDFDALLAEYALEGVLDADATTPALIAFTSGTTSDPKGVVHSHQTLGFESRQLLAMFPEDRGNQLTATPVGHFIGMLSAFLIPLLDGSPINLSDTWDPAQALRLMSDCGLTVGGGPPYFATSLLDHADFRPEHLQRLKYMGLGGASVPVAVSRRLTDMGIIVYRSYGSTEHPSITGNRPTGAEDKRTLTDGNPLEGVELRLGADGEILSRGPDLCLGYTDENLTHKAFDADGWYHTGDIGELDADGFLTITDRKSDIIIRGGENISALEVEEVLLTMPEIAEAVVVAAPDDRLGERTAAVLRLKPEVKAPSLDEIRAHFQESGVGRQKWPELVRLVDDFPRTPSGKVQKYLVRQSIRDGS